MLRKHLLSRLIDYRDDVMFQQDGAAPHYVLIVREFLNDCFPLNFFWGLLKDKVYSHEPRTIHQLRNAITEEINSIEVELCEKVFHSVRGSLRKSLQ